MRGPLHTPVSLHLPTAVPPQGPLPSSQQDQILTGSTAPITPVEPAAILHPPTRLLDRQVVTLLTPSARWAMSCMRKGARAASAHYHVPISTYHTNVCSFHHGPMRSPHHLMRDYCFVYGTGECIESHRGDVHACQGHTARKW